MKKIYLLLLLLICSIQLNSQIIIYTYCFDSTENCADYTMSAPEPILTIDLNSNPSNSWQIGIPQKTVLNTSVSSPNVMITDLINPYPINDTSAFLIESTAMESSSSVSWANFNLSFSYYVNSDTLTDYGSIEFSPDNGITWIDLINDPFYATYLEWSSNGLIGILPVLSGNSGEWKMALLRMQALGEYLNMQPGTVFKWRFSFISDGIQNSLDGLMYDDIYIEITPPIGIEEVANSNLSLSPNPVNDFLELRKNPDKNLLITIYATDNKLVKQIKLADSETKIDLSFLNKGFYFVKISDENGKVFGTERLMKL